MAAFHQSDAALSGECWYTFPGRKAYPIEEWREMNFGAYEGKNYEDLKNDSYYQKWIDSNGTLPFPEGESQQEYIKRCQRGLLTATKS